SPGARIYDSTPIVRFEEVFTRIWKLWEEFPSSFNKPYTETGGGSHLRVLSLPGCHDGEKKMIAIIAITRAAHTVIITLCDFMWSLVFSNDTQQLPL
ncbi:hypothetical protein, partial [Methanoregula sp.]|uniref:hypothetical protein n=1 Tax=Methanoregula sp. TaxID=2052170 RepID=UPI003C7089AF